MTDGHGLEVFVDAKMAKARMTRGRGTRKMLKWPRKPMVPMCRQSEKKREKVSESPPGERRLDLWPEM